jgi:uncharacterized protein YebE (UPF0316 family)
MAFYLVNPEIYALVILPLLIFLARVADVSMETIRVIYISRGIKYLAPIIAFFEIVIWLFAMEVVMSDLTNVANFFAFAFGFATGTYVGLIIEEKLSIGMVILRIITTEEDGEEEIMEFMKAEHCGVTSLEGKGTRGNVRLILSLVNRTDLPRITRYLQETKPHAFYSIEDVRYANEGVFRPKDANTVMGRLGSFLPSRKK